MASRHFTLDDRQHIYEGICKGLSIRSIAHNLGVSPSTVSRELEKHRILDQNGSFKKNGAPCERVLKAPWICNGCKSFANCRKRKYRYSPARAQSAYEATLHEVRRKIRTGSDGLNHIDHIVTPLVRDQGQTVAHIYNTYGDEIGISKSTLYRYIDDNRLTVRNIDLPARVRYPKHNSVKRGDNSTIENQKCRENRDYAAFNAYIAEHPKASIVEMDSVIGEKGRGHKVLLTLLFRKSNFMISILRDSNTAQSVIDAFNEMTLKIGISDFASVFSVVLTDNGSEFKMPEELENYKNHKFHRCHIFYCDARSSQQKARIEKNHEYIRKFVPQGKSFDGFTQKDINLMMSHINSVKRDSLGGKSPFECLSKKEMRIVKKLGLRLIPPDEVILNPSLFK